MPPEVVRRATEAFFTTKAPAHPVEWVCSGPGLRGAGGWQALDRRPAYVRHHGESCRPVRREFAV